MPRAAVVGAGVMGRWHVQAVRRLGIEPAAVVDVDRRAAEGVAAQAGQGCRVFEELAACLEQCEVDVVHVCTPPGTHAQLVHEALDRGCHVLVEKPLADSPAEVEAVLAAARGRRLNVNPVHQLPFQRGVERIQARRGELGELVRVEYVTASAGGAGWAPAERQGLLREIVPHAASLFHRFAPGFDPDEFEVHEGQEDLALVGRRGPTWLEAFITLRGRPPRNELRVTGTRASAAADLFHGFSILDRVPPTRAGKALRPFALGARLLAGTAANGARRAAGLEVAYPGLRTLIGRFYASVTTGAPPPISEDEILAAAALTDAARTGVGARR